MLVYVATPEKIESEFQRWINETNDDVRRIVHLIFKEFMSTQQAMQLFFKCTSLISFTVSQFRIEFQKWILTEIEKQPEHENKITLIAGQVIAHIDSPWCIDAGLIVRDCLEDCDYDQTIMDKAS